MKILKKFPLFIILLPIFTVLVLAANNLGEIDLNVIWRPLGISLIPPTLLFLFGWVILGNYYKAGLFSFTISLFILTYGHFYHLMEGRVIGNWVIGTHPYMLFLWSILCLGMLYLMVFQSKSPDKLNLILNIVMLALTIFQIFLITTYEARAQIIDRQTRDEEPQTLLNPENLQKMPDVYFIILDKYGRADALKDFYHYDNAEFINGLEELGFWVADCSRTNYSFTVMSLSSQLNMAFVEDLTNQPSLKTTRALIRNNVVHKAFEELGYTTIAFEMGFTWGNMKHFDYFFDEIPDNIDTWALDPFEIMYLRSTMGIFLFDGDTKIGTSVSMTDIEEKAARTKLILDVLPEIPKLKGNKFVHAHIITPHPPYIFNADGTLNPDPDEVDPMEGYRQQLAYIEPRILEVLEKIIDESPRPPIIILEGDHGFGRKYVTSNLLALYLPNQDQPELEDNMTLINVFPYIFNTYFGTQIPMLPDQSYTHTDDWYESVPNEEWNPDCRIP